MSQAIGSVDHIPSRADYLNMREDLAFREVNGIINVYISIVKRSIFFLIEKTRAFSVLL